MLSIEQLTIVAYMTDGGILCRKCGEAEGLPTKDALCAYSAGEYAGNEGLYCDSCSFEIDPPYEWVCPDCETQYYGDEAMEVETLRDETAYCSKTRCNRCDAEPEEGLQTDWTVYKTSDLAGTITRHSTQEEAEARIAEIEKTDPEGVHNGEYSIDGPTE